MNLTCEPPTECCTVITRGDGGINREQTCVRAGMCPDGGVVQECSSELSCGMGQLCCRGGVGVGGGGASTCEAMCPMGSNPVCSTDEGCPTGDTCRKIGMAATGTCVRAVAPRDGGGAPPPVRDAGVRD